MAACLLPFAKLRNAPRTKEPTLISTTQLPWCMVLYFIDLQIDQYKATQNTMIKYQINSVMVVIERDALLPSDEGQTPRSLGF